MKKETVHLLGVIIIVILWLTASIIIIYTVSKIQKNGISTYFDKIEQLEEYETPQFPPLDIIADGGYRMFLPNSEQMFDGFVVRLKPVHFKINSDGFRDREFSLEKPSNTFRIIMLGDSFVFGWGVELNDSLPKQLESILNSRQDNLDYEVLNLGLGGDIFDEVESFKAIGLKYNPDLVILCFNPTDLENESLRGELAKEIMGEYKAKGATINQIELNHKVSDLVSLRPFDEKWQGIENPLNNLTLILENKDVKLLIYSFMSNGVVNEKFLDFTYKHPAVYFEKTDIMDGTSTDIILHPLDTHPTPLAYKLHTKKIYETLIKQGLIPSNLK